MKGSQSRFPDAILERFLLGELPPSRQEEIKRFLETDSALSERLEILRLSDGEILKAYPALASLPGRTPKRAPAAGRAGVTTLARYWPDFTGWRLPPRWIQSTGLAFASLVLIAVFVAPGFWNRSELESGLAVDGRSGDEVIRLKGADAGLAIYRKSKSGAELLPPHASARPGDTLQVFYRSLRELHGIIFSVDGSGSVTLHLPEEEGLSAKLSPGEIRPVPHAYLLDRAPRMERFYLVTSPSPFAIPSILAGVRQGIRPGQPLPDTLAGLPEGFRQYSYTLKKEDAPPARGKSWKGARR